MHECCAWLGVLNHADLVQVLDRFAVMPWRVPNALQLMLMDQEESLPTVSPTSSAIQAWYGYYTPGCTGHGELELVPVSSMVLN